jgi:hypothetical protein
MVWFHMGVVADGYYIYVMGGENLKYSYIRWMDTRTEVWSKVQIDCKPIV